ncbi:hypothetical protein HMPREF9123_0815 [Neisseria bacilliformis ATCC BAA-1200]|uniref:Uncharacterized protein n=1 Tax=Neisseria bacilliformis ATCC BAA-1200 TaxID=888742 RepID=F2BAR1_9NEIS|nr:hypothetical protein HMPREF9123_0815 [Neisseria bacilliformis ATCC BAA-1200]
MNCARPSEHCIRTAFAVHGIRVFSVSPQTACVAALHILP